MKETNGRWMMRKEQAEKAGIDYQGLLVKLKNQKEVERLLISFSKDEQYGKLMNAYHQFDNDAIRIYAKMLNQHAKFFHMTRLFETTEELINFKGNQQMLDTQMNAISEAYEKVIQFISIIMKD